MCEGGTAKALTHDHRPDKEEEREAVERRGGEVVKILGTSRVQGVLGVSRSIGDRDLILKRFVFEERPTVPFETKYPNGLEMAGN